MMISAIVISQKVKVIQVSGLAMDFRHRHSKKCHDHESLEDRGIRSELSDLDLKRLSEFIYTYSGIKMPPAKKLCLRVG